MKIDFSFSQFIMDWNKELDEYENMKAENPDMQEEEDKWYREIANDPFYPTEFEISIPGITYPR